MDLFADDARPQQVVDDAEGGIRYWPRLVPAETADAWFEALQQASWSAHRRPMYDRVVDVPRLLASYAVGSWPATLPLGAILARVQALAPAPYNAVGMNLYRDGRDSVAMHNDKLHTIVAGMPIALVSLGEPRRMRIKPKGAPGRIDLDLAHGSLLVMSHAAQLTHEHGIPKTTAAIGPRMSVVFRVRPAAHAR
jgi:alkylated DNA repair dioxygenase AlkB